MFHWLSVRPTNVRGWGGHGGHGFLAWAGILGVFAHYRGKSILTMTKSSLHQFEMIAILVRTSITKSDPETQ
jgi:hypothetical protein